MTSKRYHLIGIGGIGMATLASLLLDQGHRVSGSDIKDNDLILGLRKKGACVFIGHQALQVQGADYVVYSSAIRVQNPELIEAQSRNIPVLRRAQVLANLVNEQTGITIAGAHGKTTTTSMVSTVLARADLYPTTAIGGIVNGHSGDNARLGDGRYFVAEVDESDGTFLYFKPQYAIITNIDFEHVDFYKDWEGILKAYAQFMRGLRPLGVLIICGEDARLVKLTGEQDVKALTYGFSSAHDVRAADIEMQGFQSRFSCYHGATLLGTFVLNVPGEHNILNALAAISLGLQLKIDAALMIEALKDFKGVQRRFQFKGCVGNVSVIDDYGHHPTEIKATLCAARLFKPARLITVFQPHRYSRTKFLLEEFVQELSRTDILILTDIYAASEKITEGVGIETLKEGLEKTLGASVIFLKKEDILNYLWEYVLSGDMVIFLGAGDIYHLSDAWVDRLKARKLS